MILRVEGLRFGYSRGRDIINGLDWAWDWGSHERVVLLGPNGAGKSTLMRLMAGQNAPRSGRIGLDADVASPRSLRQAVARMPQHIEPIPRLTCREQVAYGGWLNGMAEKDARSRAGDALAMAGLLEQADAKTHRLSGGQLRRLGLAEALVRPARAVLLDEPTAGLDPGQRRRFREVLAGVAGRAVLVSTHETHDIADLFDRVVVLDRGLIVYEGTPTEMRALTGSATIEDAYTALVGVES